MIYEKRNANIRVKPDDLPIKIPTATIVANVQETVDTECTVAVKGKTRRERQGRRRMSIGKVMTLCVCMIALDVFLLDGRLYEGAVFNLRKGARYALEAVAQDSTDVTGTLYTRLVSSADKAYIYNVETADAGIDDKTEMSTENSDEAVEAGNSLSSGFVDGTRYFAITSLDLSADSPYSLNNATAFSPDVQELSKKTPKALEGIAEEDGPLVLIVHTHGEECYTEYKDMYPENEATRSNDTERNVVRVGKEIADTLETFGIGTLHCTTMHDSESFINAYSGSAASVKSYLEDYPSVRVVVDVHRDAIIRDDNESVRAVTSLAGEDYAQLMFVVGTNELGHNHPGWQDNLALALTLQKSISDTYPSLCRSINLRNVPFNQQLSSGYLLLEVGTSANTLDEALRSARAFGENLARVVAAAEI